MNNRRHFLKSAALTAAPFILPSSVWSADAAPNSRITVGFIGMGKQSGHLLGAFMGQPGVQVVAVCDVDKNRRESAQKRVEERYGKDKPAGWTGCASYADFREIIARKDIDAVCIATPDHWHAYITIAALAAGKDVYCEKPLCHNVHEAVSVIDAVKKHSRVLQTGSMQRSSGEFRIAAELIQNGVIGKISRVECQFGGAPRPNDLTEEAVEPGLDWDRWLGPAPLKPYSSVLAPRGVHDHFPKWREYAEYGGGYVTDWGAHHLDIAQWGLGMDENGPVEVIPPAGSAEKIAAKKNLELEGCELVYASGIRVKHTKGGFGVHFFGENGEVKVNRGQFEVIMGGKVTHAKNEKTSVERAYLSAERDLLKDAKIKLYKSGNHIGDFIDCVRSRKKPITHEGVGGGTSIVCNLMNIAYLLGQPFKWDPAKNTFAAGTGDAKLLTRDYRGEWKV
jgi:predicted dehydrogenase